MPGTAETATRESHGVTAILIDQLQGVDDVASGLGHLPAFFVANQTIDVDSPKRDFSSEAKAHHHHPGHQKKMMSKPVIRALVG